MKAFFLFNMFYHCQPIVISHLNYFDSVFPLSLSNLYIRGQQTYGHRPNWDTAYFYKESFIRTQLCPLVYMSMVAFVRQN